MSTFEPTSFDATPDLPPMGQREGATPRERPSRVLAWLIRQAGRQRDGRVMPYVWVGCSLIAATIIRAALDPLLGSTAPHGIYVIVTVLVAWRFGLGPALASALLGTILSTYLFVEPRHVLFIVHGTENKLNFAISLLLSVTIAALSGSLRIAAAENARLYRAAHEAEIRKDEFLAMIAHELRNPLVPICNGLYMLETIGSDTPEVIEVREQLRGQVEHLMRLVDDLLDASRMTRGVIELKKERVELRSVVDAAVEISRTAIEKKSQQLDVSLPERPIVLNADRVRMTQALANLLTNAARYSDHGDRIWVSAATEDGNVAIRVRDTGIGLAPDSFTRIFELFEQVDGRGRTDGGLGVGLTLARTLVEKHGGTIEVHSPGLGYGSEFIIRLPVTDSAVPTATVEKKASGIRPAVTRHRVLVIDDNVPSAQSMAKVLRLWNHDVEVCYDGFSALEKARTFKPDIVLSDINLHRMDGYRLAAELRLLPEMKNALLIAITGYGLPEDRRRAREAGFDRHLLKPVRPEELAEAFDARPA